MNIPRRGGTSELDLVVAINNARGQGHQVILGTKDVQPALSKVEGDHAYLILDNRVQDSNNDGIEEYEFLLYNPWGGVPFCTRPFPNVILPSLTSQEQF